MSGDNAYWPFKKISAFIFKVSQHGFRSQKNLHFSKTAVKTSNLTGKKYNPHTHTHCTKQYSPAAYDVASRGEPFAGMDRSSGVRSSPLLRTCSVTKIIFPTSYSFRPAFAFQFWIITSNKYRFNKTISQQRKTINGTKKCQEH